MTLNSRAKSNRVVTGSFWEAVDDGTGVLDIKGRGRIMFSCSDNGHFKSSYSHYEGEISGRPYFAHGKGKLVMKDGSMIECDTFNLDLVHGEAVFTYPDGTTTERRKYYYGEVMVRNGIATESDVGTDHQGGGSERNSLTAGRDTEQFDGEARDAAGAGSAAGFGLQNERESDNEENDDAGDGNGKRRKLERRNN